MQCPACRREQEALASLLFDREKSEDQKGTSPSPTAGRGLVLQPLCPLPPTSRLHRRYLRPKHRCPPNKSKHRRNLISCGYSDFTQYEEDRGSPSGSSAHVSTRGCSLLGPQSPNILLLAGAVLSMLLTPLYRLQLFGAALNDMCVSWIDYQLLFT